MMGEHGRIIDGKIIFLNPLDNSSRWNLKPNLNSSDLQWGGLKQTAT
jgi:hypothetical protein